MVLQVFLHECVIQYYTDQWQTPPFFRRSFSLVSIPKVAGSNPAVARQFFQPARCGLHVKYHDIKYVQFRTICFYQYNINVNTVEVDPHSDSLQKGIVKLNLIISVIL